MRKGRVQLQLRNLRKYGITLPSISGDDPIPPMNFRNYVYDEKGPPKKENVTTVPKFFWLTLPKNIIIQISPRTAKRIRRAYNVRRTTKRQRQLNQMRRARKRNKV